MSIQDTPLKINMEPKNEGLVQMIFLFKQVMFRCKRFIFQGVEPAGFPYQSNLTPQTHQKKQNLFNPPTDESTYTTYTYLYHPPKQKSNNCLYI